MVKLCRRCKQEKDVAEFSSGRAVCKQCRVEETKGKVQANGSEFRSGLREYQKNYREKNKLAIRIQKVKKTYGIDNDFYSHLLKSQDKSCAICKRLFVDMDRTTVPCVDHDHVTGKVRGLLCVDCNRGLGSFFDNPALLLAAIEYLRKQ